MNPGFINPKRLFGIRAVLGIRAVPRVPFKGGVPSPIKKANKLWFMNPGLTLYKCFGSRMQTGKTSLESLGFLSHNIFQADSLQNGSGNARVQS